MLSPSDHSQKTTSNKQCTLEKPTRMNRASDSLCSGSKNSELDSSAHTVWASSNQTPCLRKLERFFLHPTRTSSDKVYCNVHTLSNERCLRHQVLPMLT